MFTQFICINLLIRYCRVQEMVFEISNGRMTGTSIQNSEQPFVSMQIEVSIILQKRH